MFVCLPVPYLIPAFYLFIYVFKALLFFFFSLAFQLEALPFVCMCTGSFSDLTWNGTEALEYHWYIIMSAIGALDPCIQLRGEEEK